MKKSSPLHMILTSATVWGPLAAIGVFTAVLKLV